MSLGQEMWDENGEQETNSCKDCAYCFVIFNNSSFHCHTLYIPGTSLSSSISHLNGLLGPPPASFSCLQSPVFFTSFLFRMQLLFSGFLIRSQNLYFPFCSTCIQLLPNFLLYCCFYHLVLIIFTNIIMMLYQRINIH